MKKKSASTAALYEVLPKGYLEFLESNKKLHETYLAVLDQMSKMTVKMSEAADKILEQPAASIMWMKVIERLQKVEEVLEQNNIDLQLIGDQKVYPIPFCDKFVVHMGAICKKQALEPIPPEEPVFVVRARDKFALRLLNLHLALCADDNATTWQLESVKRSIRAFEFFKHTYPERMKQPGITQGK